MHAFYHQKQAFLASSFLLTHTYCMSAVQHSREKIVRAMEILADSMVALGGTPCRRPTRPRQGACPVPLLLDIHQVIQVRLALLPPPSGAHCDAQRAEAR